MKIIYYRDKYKKQILDLIEDENIREALCASSMPYVPDTGNNALMLVAVETENPEKLLGYIYATYNGKKSELYISCLAVAPIHQKKGVGEALVNRLILVAKQGWAIQTIDTYTVENRPAEDLFKKCGFEYMGTYKDHVFTGGRRRSQVCWRKNVC